jgi:hypothetical protein
MKREQAGGYSIRLPCSRGLHNKGGVSMFSNINYETSGELEREIRFTYKEFNWKATAIYAPFGNGWKVTEISYNKQGREVQLPLEHLSEGTELMIYRLENFMGGDV